MTTTKTKQDIMTEIVVLMAAALKTTGSEREALKAKIDQLQEDWWNALYDPSK